MTLFTTTRRHQAHGNHDGDYGEPSGGYMAQQFGYQLEGSSITSGA